MDSPDLALALLEVRGLSKSFGRVRALQDVDFTLRAGEIHALLGENGAGKSTLIKVVTGVLAARRGQSSGWTAVEIAPRSAKARSMPASPPSIRRSICCRTCRWRRICFSAASRRASAWFATARDAPARDARCSRGFGLDIDVAAPLGDYSVAIQQWSRSRAPSISSARVLVLDEPTASLDRHEVEMLFASCASSPRAASASSSSRHFLDQVYEISDRITVLRNGRLVGERETRDAAAPGADPR